MSLRGQRDPVGDQLEELDVVVEEPARRHRADVDDTDEVPADEQRCPEDRPHILIQEDRVDRVRVVDVLDPDGVPLGRDATDEPSPDRDAKALPNLFLGTSAGRGDQFVGRLVEQQDRGGVDVEEFADPVKQFVQQVLEVQMRERDVGHCFDPLQPHVASRLPDLRAHGRSVTESATSAFSTSVVLRRRQAGQARGDR